MAIILENEPLWNKTTFRTGGPARWLVIPETSQEVGRWIRSGDVELIMGGGSNLLIADAGIKGVALLIGRGRMTQVEVEPVEGGEIRVKAGAGVLLTRLAGAMMKQSVAGLEFAYGIPGALGGALVMNAGAGDGEMKDVVESVTIINADGVEKIMSADQCGFVYRGSGFPEGAVITGAVMRLRRGGRGQINAKMRRLQLERKKTQPLGSPSAGSVYKNPDGDFAGRLIDAGGFKGARVGGAQVSTKHANFIINRGGAMARDVVALMELVEKGVYDRFGVLLQREIRLAGQFDG